MKLKIIKTQKQFDKIARELCEASYICETEDCIESCKAGYLYALQQLYNFRESGKYRDCSDYKDKIDKKIDEYTYLEIFKL